MKKQSTRYFAIDGIRGLAIVNMILFHFFYDVFIVFGRNPGWYELPIIHIWQQMICQTFIFISGFVWQWGIQGNRKRGLLLNVYGLGVSLVTLIFTPQEAIWFGILNFMGCAVLLMYPLRKILRNLPPLPGLLISLFLFALCRQIPCGQLGLFNRVWIKLPDMLYSVKILTPVGFPFPGFSSADYFPVFPWIFLYLCGYFGYGIFLEHPSWQQAAKHNIPVLSAIGRKSILIYLIHQPVCMLACMLLFH